MKPIDDEDAPIVVEEVKEEESQAEVTGPVLLTKKMHQLSKVENDNLPCCNMYERSYMHKDIVTHSIHVISCGLYHIRSNCERI